MPNHSSAFNLIDRIVALMCVAVKWRACLNQITIHRVLRLGDVNAPGIGNNHVYLEQMRNVHRRPHRPDQRCACARANLKLKSLVIHLSTYEPSRQRFDDIGSFQHLGS